MTAEREAMNDLQAEANLRQRRAADPAASVWVGASAGSGKTSVLVNRLLRLMLPGEDRGGTPPSSILCITFTKAGASEITERVIKILRNWSIAPQDALKAEMAALLQHPADDRLCDKARALFARVIETPGGMKIYTIHAFCQSVLARFPMEAGLPAGFEVMVETESAQLMRDVRRAIVTRLQSGEPADRDLKAAFDHLSTVRNAEEIERLMEMLMGERGRLRQMLSVHDGLSGLTAAVEKYLNVEPGADADDVVRQFCAAIPEVPLRALMPRLSACNKTNQAHADILASLFVAAERAPLLDSYRAIFLTDKNTPRKLTGMLRDDDTILRLFDQECARLNLLDQTLRNIATAFSTNALLRFAVTALNAYEAEKRRRNRLDFEDLIDRTKRLLSHGGVDWVQYKLDGGIDHILVDEAQDTNPDQWDIVSALYDEFYSGNGMREDVNRTTFVVGDEKQSIFSFQRADPRVFAQQHERLEAATTPTGTPLRDVPMRISFRSAPSILDFVDKVFEPAAMRDGVLQMPGATMQHFARRSGKAGHVELWPLLTAPPKPEREAWSLPAQADTAESPVTQLSDQLADKIADLLNNPAEQLKSRGRRIRPGDIMILLAKRKPLAEAILKSLRRRHIPVTGIDRMVVTRQLGVLDVLAACQFILQPEDDLNLASLLKSPLLGLDDDALFKLAHGRTRPLWYVLRERGGEVTAWLSDLLSSEGSVASILHRILLRPCPTDPRSGLRALLARLGEDARDPLQELLARADAYDRKDVRGLQGFVQDALNDTSQLKRDLDESDDRVRLITVHGSKGLEAPIVFLPDTIRAKASRMLKDPILWPERGDTHGVPLWARNTASASDSWRNRRDAAQTRGDEEQRRLLYVALTRAAERLYIGGAQRYRDQDTDPNSWYFHIHAGMRDIGVENDGIYTLENPQTDPVTPEAGKTHIAAQVTLEPWLTAPAPAPGLPPRPLMPSKPEADDPAVMSPLFGDISHRYKRGRIIHTLFQFLPNLPADERLPRAAEWLDSPAHNLNVAEQNEILEATFNVLGDPAFKGLFSAGTRAEVPLTGHLTRPDGTHAIVSGQIDRLCVSDTQVTVLDYKTNRPAPKTIDEVPEAYRRQMRTYREILGRIWPDRAIRTCLLWTDGPALMDLTDTL